jgi:hypothetical protein
MLDESDSITVTCGDVKLGKACCPLPMMMSAYQNNDSHRALPVLLPLCGDGNFKILLIKYIHKNTNSAHDTS